MKKLYGLVILILFLLLGSKAQAQSEKNSVKGLRNSANHVELFSDKNSDEVKIRILNPKYKNLQFQVFNVLGNAQDSKIEEFKGNKTPRINTNYKWYKLNTGNLASGYYLLILKDPKTHFYRAVKFQKTPE